MTERLASLLRAVRPLFELRALVAVVLLGTAAWVFIELADEVIEGEAIPLDETLLLALRTADDPALPIGPVWLQEVMRDVTALGGYTVLSIVTLATAAYLWLARQGRLAGLILLAAVGAVVWTFFFKLGFDRPRPDLVPHAMRAPSPSFPSGHSTAAAAVYLTFGALLAWFQERRRLKLFFVGIAVTITLLVGISRIYLGVHWPSDVVAGWSLGGGWAIFCWLIATWLRWHQVLPQADQVKSDDASASSGPAATTAARPRAGGRSRVS